LLAEGSLSGGVDLELLEIGGVLPSIDGLGDGGGSGGWEMLNRGLAWMGRNDEGNSSEGCIGDGDGKVTMLATATDRRNGHDGVRVQLLMEELERDMVWLLVGCLKERVSSGRGNCSVRLVVPRLVIT
jgi:hypothetical protein